MHLIDRIGPYLGVIAFVGLSVLAVLVFLEAREVRRLREWAGRAPERAAEAAEASAAASDAKGERSGEEPPGVLGRLAGSVAAFREGVRERVGPAYGEFDRRSPVDPRLLLGVLVAALVAVGVLTGGFGLGGSGGGGTKGGKATAPPDQLKVAVLNGSQEAGVAGVPGLAKDVLRQVVKPAGYRAGKVTDAPTSYAKSVVLFASGESADAKDLAGAAKAKLGSLKTQPMSSDVSAIVGKAPLALVIGIEDKSFGQ